MAARRKIGRKGLALIKSFESFVPYVYDDLLPPVKGRYREWDGGAVKGTLTIGYGHTDAARHPLKIKQGLRISEGRALNILDVDLDECEAAVNALVRVPLTQGQFDALVSFAFNCGTGNLKKLIAPLNRGDPAACRRKFDEFIRSKGQVLRGLVRRRDAEQALWDDRADDVALPEEPVDHPAEVDTPRAPSMLTSKEGNTILAAGALDGLHTAAEASSSVTQLKQNADEAGALDLLGAALQNPKVLIGIAIALLLAGAWYWRYRRRQEETR